MDIDKKLFDDFEHPEMLPFVPQRRAAKKASAQLSEHNLWRKTQQEAYLAELAQIQIEKENNRKRSKKGKRESHMLHFMLQLCQRTWEHIIGSIS